MRSIIAKLCQKYVYVVELGTSSRGTIALSGYVKVRPGVPCVLAGGIAPLLGTAVVVDDKTAVVGWQVISIDQNGSFCIGYREQLSLNLHTGVLDGEFFFDSELPSRVFGLDHLELIACHKPHVEGNQNPLKRFDK